MTVTVSKPLSVAELREIKRDMERHVRRASWMSAGAAIVPVPLFDMVFDVGVLVNLVPKINEAFGLAPEQIDQMTEQTRMQVWRRRAERGSELIGMVVTRELIKRGLQNMTSRVVAKQVAKYIPLGGQIVAATWGYFIMKKLAMHHVEDCYEVALTAHGHATDTPR